MRRIWIVVFIFFLVVNACILHWWSSKHISRKFDGVIHKASQRYHLHPALIKAVVWRESRFDSDARGGAGEIGLMQIREAAALEWAEAENIRPFRHENLIDAGTNTLAGTWYLEKLMKRYLHTDNPLPYALADYNAGRRHVLRWNHGAGETNSQVFYKQITYPGTQNYIKSIMQKYMIYKKNYHQEN